MVATPASRTSSTGVRVKFAAARAEMASALIERDDEIDLVLTALIAKEHVLLVGPPGCAKSLLLDSLFRWVGGTKFSLLLTKYTVPEEVVGPVSLAGLKEDRYLRITAGKLPEADFTYLDEIFKSSSAILNTLLRILNERTFDAGDGVARKVPLKLCVAASNEWPSPETGKELSALFDRFCFRKAVRPIRTQAGRNQWRKRNASGDVVIVRYADDFVLGFQRHREADRFLNELRERLEKFGLRLHPEKTRLIEFDRLAAARRESRGRGRQDSFDFLGFTHRWVRKRGKAGFVVRRTTAKTRLRAKLKEVGGTLRK
jgi:MoxR-like ATPase